MNNRFALTIGNSNYQNENPVSGIKDADLMAKHLALLDFEVLPSVLDGTLAEMSLKNRALKDLKAKIGHASVVVFFFSGHGFQIGSESYLMPIDGTTSAATSLPLSEVGEALSNAPQEAIKLVILDACRPQTTSDGAWPGLDPDQAPPLKNTFYAFAAGAGQSTPAGAPDDFSRFSEAVLQHIREPGVGIGELFDKVSAALSLGVTPTIVNNDVPATFTLREAVTVLAKVTKADDDLFLLFGEDVALTASQGSQARLQLKAGDNPFALMVANDKTYRNNHDWSTTEGWGYEMGFGQDGAGSTFNGLSIREPGEEIPFKDGPHHGKLFRAASGNLSVDAEPKLATVEVRDLDTQVWQEMAPFYAQSQAILYEKSLADLPINLEDVAADALNLDSLGPVLALVLRQVLDEVIRSGTLVGVPIADPEKIFFLVLGNGNQKVRDLVQICMNDRIDERVDDLKKALAAALAREDRPFDTFDENLTKAVQEQARLSGMTDHPKPEEIKVWTALDDRSKP
jgi:hypothetical protein